MIRYITLLALWCLSQVSFSQKLIFFNAKKLPETINSELDEVLPILSADGNTLFFVRSELSGGKGGEDIWYSIRSGKNDWSEAKNDLKNLNNKEANFIVGISRENERMYLRNAYDKKLKKVISIAGSDYVNGEWSEPHNVPALPDFGFRGKYYSMYISHNEQFLFIAMNIPGSNGQEDLYLLRKNADNTWTLPIHLGDNINSKGAEFAPFITEDGKYLFFSSDGHGGYGDMDIFMSERLDDSYEKWSDPMNLGVNINSKGFDAYFHLTHDNTVFFASTRGEAQYEDIYMSEMHIFEKQKRTVIIHDLNNIEMIGKDEKKFKFQTLPSLKDYLITHRGDTLITGDLSDYEYDIVFQLDSNSTLEEKLTRLQNLQGFDNLEQLFVNNHILTGEHIDFDNLDAALKLLEELDRAVVTSDSIAAEPMAKAEPTPTAPVEEKTEKATPSIDIPVYTVYFDLNSAALTDEQLRLIKEYGQKGQGKMSISLTAYTCNLGSYEYNKQLSNQRMKTVADALKGIATVKTRTFKGQLEGNDESVRGQQRKVEIRFEKK